MLSLIRDNQHLFEIADKQVHLEFHNLITIGISCIILFQLKIDAFKMP